MDKPFFTRTQPYGDLRLVIEHWYDTEYTPEVDEPCDDAGYTLRHWIGITAEVWTQPRDGWTEGYCIGRSGGLWGIESDSDPAYLVEIEREEMRSAIDSANETRRLLTNMVNDFGDLRGDRPVQSDT